MRTQCMSLSECVCKMLIILEELTIMVTTRPSEQLSTNMEMAYKIKQARIGCGGNSYDEIRIRRDAHEDMVTILPYSGCYRREDPAQQFVRTTDRRPANEKQF